MPLINNHQLYLETYGPGDAQTVVLLHHGLGSVGAWRKQIPALVGAEFRVIAYDRWGYGGSTKRNGIDMPGFSQDLSDLESLLDQLAIPKAALVGHSDGGTIALYFAARYPERVTCLVTIAAHIYVEPQMEPGILGLQQLFEQDARFQAGLRRSHGDKAKTVFYNWFSGWHRPECLGWDIRSQLSQIICPVLVVQGSQDEHATPQHAQDITAAIPDAELWLAEGAGHMLPQENPVDFNNRLLTFLKSHIPNQGQLDQSH